MKKFFQLSFIGGLLFIGSCKTDMDVNAPYQDITVVYGLLNQNDEIQYVKINKAFLGQADVADMAQVQDSSEYKEDEIKVEVIEIGGSNRTFLLNDTLINGKDSGFFYAPEQTIYFFKASPALNASAKYKLKITNSASGKVVTAETELIQSFAIKTPGTAPQKTIAFANKDGLLNVKPDFTSAVNGRRYEIKMFFNYQEVRGDDTITPPPVEWLRKGIKSISAKGGEQLISEFTGHEFFDKIKNQLPDDPSVERLAVSIDFVFVVGGEELNTYMEVNEPSSGLVQDKPEYTNLSNGIGVFSSRYEQFVSDKAITSGTASYLKTSDYSKTKGFTKYYIFTPSPQYIDIP